MEASNAPSTPPRSQRFLSLAPHCAILGFVGAWLTADSLGVGGEDAIRWLLLIVTPLVSAGLGRYLSTRLDRGILATLFLVITSVGVAGLLNGVLVGFFIAPPIGMVIGLIFGMMCSVPFMPAISLVALAARRSARARASSIIERADRRAAWVAICVITAFGAAAQPFFSSAGATGSAMLPFASLAVILAVLSLDVTAFFRAGALRERLSSTHPIPPETLPERVEAGVPAIDFGLGDEGREEIAALGPVYRDRERPLRVFHGSADRARAALGWAITVDIAALLVAAGCLLTRYSDLLRFPVDFIPTRGGSWM